MKIESPTPDPIKNGRADRSAVLYCRAIFPVQRSVVQPLSGADGLRHQAQGIVEHRQARAVAMSVLRQMSTEAAPAGAALEQAKKMAGDMVELGAFFQAALDVRA